MAHMLLWHGNFILFAASLLIMLQTLLGDSAQLSTRGKAFNSWIQTEELRSAKVLWMIERFKKSY